MRKVKDAVDLTTNEKIYFKGHAKATYLSDGRNVEEAIFNLPSGDSSVFEAVYGVTTHAEVLAAFKEGKHCLCVRDGLIYNLVRVTETDNLLFTCVNQVYAYTLTLTMGNAWFPTLYTIEKDSNKVKTINAESTDTQYPSAKAVYDFVSNTLGTIINGDY